MKYQQVFASIYSRPPARRGYPPLGHAELVRLAAPLWELGERLALPQLEPWQRKELGEADVPELRPLLLAYGQLLQARPELGRALGLTQSFVEALRRKEVALGSLVEMLEQLLQAITDARLLSVAELRHQNVQVAEAVRRLSADESVPAAERDSELASFGSVRRLREERLQKRKRTQRRTERRLEPLRSQLRDLSDRAESARLAAELGAPRAAGAPSSESSSPIVGRRAGGPRARWIGSDRAGELLQSLRRGGTPLERCLSTDPDEIDACGAEVGRIKGKLGVPELSAEERRELGGRDALRECNMAIANAQALRGAPRVAELAGQTPKALEDGCQAILALDRLELGASLILRDALDGRVVAMGMVALLHRQAQDWLGAALEGDIGEEDRRRLLGDFAATLGIAEQAGERREAQEAREGRKASDLSAQVEEAAAEAHLQETVERLRAGEAVPREALLRAEATRAAGRERRKKPR